VISKTSSTEALEIFQKEPVKFDPVITDMAAGYGRGKARPETHGEKS
jgi:hypothetical protein